MRGHEVENDVRAKEEASCMCVCVCSCLRVSQCNGVLKTNTQMGLCSRSMHEAKVKQRRPLNQFFSRRAGGEGGLIKYRSSTLEINTHMALIEFNIDLFCFCPWFPLCRYLSPYPWTRRPRQPQRQSHTSLSALLTPSRRPSPNARAIELTQSVLKSMVKGHYSK